MSAFNHTLSAYEISFRYRKGFVGDNTASFPSNDLLVSIILDSYTDNKICENVGYVLKLEQPGNKAILDNDVERIFITPNSGRRGRPTKIYSLEDGNRKAYTFDSNWASTYQNNVFLYSFPNGKKYCVFHRVGNSGCKTIFARLCNELLKPKGIIMDMEWIPPRSKKGREKTYKYEISGLRVISRERNNSSDITDRLNKGKKRERIVKDLRINLRSPSNSRFLKIVSDCKDALSSQREILEKIKPELNEDYSEVLVSVSFGGIEKTVSWDNIENLFPGFDITDKVKNSGDLFLSKLVECSDEYIFELTEDDE